MINQQKEKQKRKVMRTRRVRIRVQGTAQRPRLCVMRSLKHMQAQIIDDARGVTMFGAIDSKEKYPGTKQERAYVFGKDFATRALAKSVTSVVFDRGSRAYHGRIEAFARGAREGGLIF